MLAVGMIVLALSVAEPAGTVIVPEIELVALGV
jgi:hypothetical protein